MARGRLQYGSTARRLREERTANLSLEDRILHDAQHTELAGDSRIRAIRKNMANEQFHVAAELYETLLRDVSLPVHIVRKHRDNLAELLQRTDKKMLSDQRGSMQKQRTKNVQKRNQRRNVQKVARTKFFRRLPVDVLKPIDKVAGMVTR